MSLTISLMVQYNNNLTKCLTGLHSSKGMDYTTENELNEWSIQMIDQIEALAPLKPHKKLYIEYNHSYTVSTKSSYNATTHLRDINNAIGEIQWQMKLAKSYI